MDLATERGHLVKAERDIAEGEERIARQTDLIERMRENGQSTTEAERLLATFRQTLRTWCDHRDAILLAIARLEEKPHRPSQDAAPSAD